MIKPLIIGISGASSLIYALRALKFLLAADYEIELVASHVSYMVWQAEENIRMPAEPDKQELFWREKTGVLQEGKLHCHRWGDAGAAIATGSFRTLKILDRLDIDCVPLNRWQGD